MENFKVVMSLIGLLFASVFGVYIWTFKIYKGTQASLGKIYEVMNADFVREKVCTTMHEALKEDVSEIKADVKTLLTK